MAFLKIVELLRFYEQAVFYRFERHSFCRKPIIRRKVFQRRKTPRGPNDPSSTARGSMIAYGGSDCMNTRYSRIEVFLSPDSFSRNHRASVGTCIPTSDHHPYTKRVTVFPQS